MTERWALRREKLFLMPGDSPAGFRLPLGSLPVVTPTIQYPHVLPRDPFANAPPLPQREVLLQRRRTVSLESPAAAAHPASARSAGSVRTAMTVEPRGGRVCVFMPPLEDAEDYAALVAAIEETARTTKTPVHLEGYPPPHDPRINVIKVTPDPGVIEVNVQPATRWEEAVDITTSLYEEAHLSRLSTEKFMIDGRHTGTGGGNHIVLGGLTPADSPFLRRPDLLASIIAYWQNHPSLSFLFSGLFIGPTSQAPRVDEARHESLYELEIALGEIPDPGMGSVPPWLVDRIFRNLLIDVTGNTHRAEICIDKLYSPDSSTGRLGLVEFRSFEMPPHARMSLAQQLLLRALIVRFWERPYRAEARPLGHGLARPLHAARTTSGPTSAPSSTTSRATGCPSSWNGSARTTTSASRKLGSIAAFDVELELRQALEPWHVLGEEGAPGGTARYVDSSLERVEVKVRGLTGDRFIVTCNGRTLPLNPTGTAGEAVSGVRYRAWWPPSALHPTISPHVPLVFDLVDTWSGRSVARLPLSRVPSRRPRLRDLPRQRL